MWYSLLILKRKLEDLIILPFIKYGHANSARLSLDDDFDIFFFFPFYHIGGAEKVHAQVSSALGNRKAVIFFTRKSHNDFFFDAFKASGHRIIDISAYTDNKWRYWNNLIYRGILSSLINRQQIKTVVFNGHSNFAYKLSRWIRKDIPQIELIHSLNSFSYIRIPYISFYYETVMISRNRISDHLKLYKNYGIPSAYGEKIRLIPNGIPLPLHPKPKSFAGRLLNLLYAGRGTSEKRVHLVAEIAEACLQLSLTVTITYMGDVSGAIPKSLAGKGNFPGNISDPSQINHIYEEADILLVTSSEEGFPMVVMEAMARGCIILATPVGDLPIHIKNGINGYLFSQVADENKIIKEGRDLVRKLMEDTYLCSDISANNIAYAAEHFGLATFDRNYQQLFDTYLT